MMIERSQYILWAFLILVLYCGPIYVMFPALAGNDYSIPYITPFFENNFYWSYPIVMTVGAGITIFIGYKLGFYKAIRKTLAIKNIVFLIFAIILGIIVSALIVHYFQWIFFYGNDTQTESNDLNSWIPQFFIPILNSILAPIYEETMFRGCLYRALGDGKIALFVISVLFAWIHTGFTTEFFYYFPSSLIITFAYYRRKALIDSLLVHAGYNTFLNLGFNVLSSILSKI